MRCPQCRSDTKQAVKETRTGPDGRIARRRRCPDCEHSFWTVEQLSETGVQVPKANGRVVPFVRDSIRTNINKAAARGIPARQLDGLVDAVVADVYPLASQGPIPTSAIADAVLKRLRALDQATHIRFALVHAGRQDRHDTRQGWRGIPEVRQWLIREYPQLQYYHSPARLTMVVKRDGRRMTYDRQQLEQSVAIASRGRGVRDDVERLAVDVANDVERALGDQPIVTSGQITSEILRSLRDREHVAYLRFASTAKGFASPEDYAAETASLGGLNPPE